MYEVHYKYSFDTFSGAPRRDVQKIPECQILKYDVLKGEVELIVQCENKEIAEKLKHYMLIRFELFSVKEVEI